MYSGHGRLCVCVSLCLSLAAFSHILHEPGCKLLEFGIIGVPSTCALLGGFAIGGRVSLL